MNTQDPFDLDRFVTAQNGVFDRAVREIQGGKKASHWMWFIFPQIEGLGSSSMAIRYAIRSMEEARAYLDHPVLCNRLKQCCEALLNVNGKSATEILGWPDDLKLRSFITLYFLAAPANLAFESVLAKYIGVEPDPRTIAIHNRLSA